MSRICTVLALITISGCISLAGLRVRSADYAFFEMEHEAQLQKFRNLNANEQWHLVGVGTRAIEPPALYLIGEFARGGVKVIPLLRLEINSSSDEVVVRDVVHVLSEMQRKGIYAVKEDESLMAMIRERVQAMHGLWRDFSIDRLRRIEQ